MKRHQTATRLSALLLLALFAVVALPLTGLAADDAQTEREVRRLENELRRQQEQAQREMDERARVQSDALRGQEEAIRRMEATQARMLADAQQRAQQSADQTRIYTYPYYPDRAPSTPSAPTPPAAAAIPPATPAVPLVVDRAQADPVSSLAFASTQSGVLVVSAGGKALFGLQDGDVIISVDGRVPADGPHAARILRSYLPGERLRLRVQRNRQVIDLDSTAPGQRSN